MNNNSIKLRMHHYRWQGINQQGQRVRGNNSANSREDLRHKLLTEGIYLTRIHNIFTINDFLTINTIRAKHITDMTQQLTLLLQAGIELTTALNIIICENPHHHMQKLLVDIKQQLEQGLSFSVALGQHAKYFDAIYRSLVAAGEVSGKLASLLNQLTAYHQRLVGLQQKLVRALFYPIIIAAVAGIIICGLLLFVVPQFEKVFTSMNANLPALTQDVIFLTHTLRTHGAFMLLTVLAMVIILRHCHQRNRHYQQGWQAFLLWLPGVKDFIQLGNLARILRIIYTVTNAGLPLIAALELSKPALTLHCYQASMQQTLHALENGQSLQQALQLNFLFNKRDKHMLAVAENTGDLLPMLHILAEENEQRLDQLLDRFSTFLEPCVMLLLAIIMGSLIIAMYLPVFALGSIM